MARLSAEAVAVALGLEKHPEGGRFKEIYRSVVGPGERGGMTSIYYLLVAGESSAWHRLREADEIWHFHAGDPLALHLATDNGVYDRCRLGSDIKAGERPQVIVPAGRWQSAEPLGHWRLAGCAVSPAFEFSDFEMAPADFNPRAADG